jgi:hypothetical protein
MSFRQSPRLGKGVDGMDRLLRDFDLRIAMVEQKYIGHKKAVGVTAAKDSTSFPEEPTPGDRALDLSTGQVYTASATGVWNLGGTPIP